MVKIVLIALSVVASVAMAFPAQNSEDLERIPVRVVRSENSDYYQIPKYGYMPGVSKGGSGSETSAASGPAIGAGYVSSHSSLLDYNNYRHGSSSIGNAQSNPASANAGHFSRN